MNFIQRQNTFVIIAILVGTVSIGSLIVLYGTSLFLEPEPEPTEKDSRFNTVGLSEDEIETMEIAYTNCLKKGLGFRFENQLDDNDPLTRFEYTCNLEEKIYQTGIGHKVKDIGNSTLYYFGDCEDAYKVFLTKDFDIEIESGVEKCYRTIEKREAKPESISFITNDTTEDIDWQVCYTVLENGTMTDCVPKIDVEIEIKWESSVDFPDNYDLCIKDPLCELKFIFEDVKTNDELVLEKLDRIIELLESSGG